uniref:Uncharacterized protein n=1 Tax=Esox lucius TaxID=8010 RepID=A0A6Q2YNC4_ESOLU
TRPTPGPSTSQWTPPRWASTTTTTSSSSPWTSAPSGGKWTVESTGTPCSLPLMSGSCTPTATSTTPLTMTWWQWHANYRYRLTHFLCSFNALEVSSVDQ